jgi:tRNA (pseudouridine54-N1)-methyltransferase
MRNFIVVGHKATTSPNFSLEDIPGTSGRLDILCRSVTAAFVISHGIRKDVSVYLLHLGGEIPKTILLKGETLRHLNPDERTTAALLKKALALTATPEWSMSTSGIYVRSGGLTEILQDIKAAKIVYLRENGADICSMDQSDLVGESAFILGDHMGMTTDEEGLISNAGAEVISLGPTSLHADQCIVIMNWILDRC